MPIDPTETAALELTDHGEALTVNGTPTTGVFIEGTVKPDEDAPSGIDIIKKATARISPSVTVAKDNFLVRTADASTWEVTNADTAYGTTTLELQRVERHSFGKM